MTTNAEVILAPGELAESACKRLKRDLLRAGVFKEMKRRSFYEKPSVKLRRKKAEAAKKRRKRERPQREYEASLDRRGIRENTERVNPTGRPSLYPRGPVERSRSESGVAGTGAARVAGRAAAESGI